MNCEGAISNLLQKLLFLLSSTLNLLKHIDYTEDLDLCRKKRSSRFSVLPFPRSIPFKQVQIRSNAIWIQFHWTAILVEYWQKHAIQTCENPIWQIPLGGVHSFDKMTSQTSWIQNMSTKSKGLQNSYGLLWARAFIRRLKFSKFV